MKSILIAINVMLAILAAGEVIKCLTEKEDAMPARVSTTAKTAKETSNPIASTPAKASPITQAIQRSPQQIEEQVKSDLGAEHLLVRTYTGHSDRG